MDEGEITATARHGRTLKLRDESFDEDLMPGQMLVFRERTIAPAKHTFVQQICCSDQATDTKFCQCNSKLQAS